MYSNIQNVQDEWTYVFTGTGTGSVIAFHVPNEARFLNIICVGAGGGGTAGTTGAVSVATRAGGRAGGSGAIWVADYPTSALPSVIYIIPGVGGAGGATTAAAGATGTVSAVSLTPLATNLNSHLAYATAGLGSATAAAVTTQTSIAFSTQTSIKSTAGQIGRLGGGTAGSSTTYANNSPIIGGGGGGLATLTGSVSNYGDTLQTLNPAALFSGYDNADRYKLTNAGGNPTTTFNGNRGLFSLAPLSSTGGSGAAANFGATGGTGGKGGPSAGGGGGGAGVTFGPGGAGGEGLIILTCW